MHFAIWKACARLGLIPPGVKRKWDDNDSWTQALILAFDQVCDHDEVELMGAGIPKVTAGKAR